MRRSYMLLIRHAEESVRHLDMQGAAGLSRRPQAFLLLREKQALRLFKYASRLFKYASRRFHKEHKGLAKGWAPTLTLPCGTPKAHGKAHNTSEATRENGTRKASVRSFTFWENKLDTVSEHRSMLISLSIQTGHAERTRGISSTPVIPHSSW